VFVLGGLPELSFGVIVDNGEEKTQVVGAVENPEGLGAWTKQVLADFRELGDELRAGPVSRLEGRNATQAITLFTAPLADVCIGWRPGIEPARIRDLTNLALSLWAS